MSMSSVTLRFTPKKILSLPPLLKKKWTLYQSSCTQPSVAKEILKKLTSAEQTVRTVSGLGLLMMLTKADLMKQPAAVCQTKWLQTPMITSALAKIARLVLVKDVTPARSVGHHSMSSDGRALKKCADAHPEKPQRSSLGVNSAPTCTMATAELTATCARRPLLSMELLSANAILTRPAK